jgi:DNA-binding PadR family transcriptional regulator
MLICVVWHYRTKAVTLGRTKTTTTPKAKIILALAVTKEIEQYKLPKITKLSYRTILRTLKPLEEQNLIKLVRTEPSKKGGKEKKIYTLALDGLIFSFLQPETWGPEGKILKIISSHPEMLLTFKKWELFKNNQLEEFVLNDCLTPAISGLSYVLKYWSSNKHPFFPVNSNMIKQSIDDAVLYGALSLNSPYVPKLMELYKNDPEISELITKNIAQQKKQYQDYNNTMKMWTSVPTKI